jgi:cytochrome c biogenesis protein CcmG, thiol:disulfide interchange protein DsbE
MMRYLNVLALSAAFLVGSVSAAHAAAPTLDLTQYRGKVVYLDFWASWCKPCRQSFPWMNAMQQKYSADGLVVVAVNVDEQRSDADKFLKEMPASFTVVYDTEGKLAEQYNLIGMPSSFLIGKDGTVVQKHEGFFGDSPAKYEAEIRQALGKP